MLDRLKKIIRRWKGEAGIGLVETLVATAILGVGVVAFITDLSAGSIAVNVQNESVIAQGLAQTQMEAIKAAPYSSTGASYTTISAPPGYAITINTNSSIYSDNQIQKITVTVTHDSNTVLTLEEYKVNR
jgi:Tfp pilus assembly protein PilV